MQEKETIIRITEVPRADMSYSESVRALIDLAHDREKGWQRKALLGHLRTLAMGASVDVELTPSI